MSSAPFLSWLLLPALALWPCLAQSQNPGAAAAAVSSEALQNQPGRLSVPPPPTPAVPPASPAPDRSRLAVNRSKPIDPLLDTRRPRNSQLTVENEQKLDCGGVEVVVPAGLYKQIAIVNGPDGKTAIGGSDLRSQAEGLGYIRYLGEAKLQVGGFPRIGGIDVGVRPEDNLPVRIWYKKMTEPDGWTKALTFILPPAGLIAGAGAWSSGNLLIPEPAPKFTEARDYYLKPPKPVLAPGEIPKPAHVRPILNPDESGPMRVRSK